MAPKESGRPDYVGAFAVTAGHRRRRALPRASRRTTTTTPRSSPRRSPTGSPRRSPRCCTSARARSGATGRTRASRTEDLIRERYRGIRPAPGYPACPDHTEKRTLFALLDVGDERRHPLTENLRDDARELGERLLLRAPRGALLRRRAHRARPGRGLRARARGWTLDEAERWLAPNLGYEPEGAVRPAAAAAR